MSDTIAKLEPQSIWRQFEAISAIPRCSKHENAVRMYVQQQAKATGATAQTDAAGNLVVKRAGIGSAASRPTVVLQGHLDMVCEKNMGVDHDFAKDGIRLVQDGAWLRAADTTLGADNGIAVAMMLALLEEKPDACPPLECIFTVDEETGLTGALGIDPTMISGRTLINLDTEEEGFICIGCAGGRNTYGTVPFVWELQNDSGRHSVSIVVHGLKGGHSGVDIHEGRGNAIVCAARILRGLVDDVPSISVSAIFGGDKHNAIPREARIDIAVDGDARSAVSRVVADMLDAFREEFGDSEPGIDVDVTDAKTDGQTQVISGAEVARLADCLLAIPNGVLGMSKEVPGLVETSTNLAAIRIEQGELRILTSQRSSRQSLIDWASELVGAAIRLAGGSVRGAEGYPAWPPRLNSPLLQSARDAYKHMFGKDPEIGAIHAGLECGVIGDRVGDMDMISIGPDMEGVHTPDERLNVASTIRTFDYLKELVYGL